MEIKESIYSDGGIVVIAQIENMEWFDATKEQVAFLLKSGTAIRGAELLSSGVAVREDGSYTKEEILTWLRARYEALIKRRDNAANMNWYTSALARSTEAQAIDTLIDDIEAGSWDE